VVDAETQRRRQAKRTPFSNKQRQATFTVNNLSAIGPGIFLEKADRFRISTEKYVVRSPCSDLVG
jgi:hypothetical protein